MAYKFLEHKADVLFEATAESFPALAEEAAAALFETMAHTTKLKPSESVVIEARAKSLDELLVFALGNLLSESDANNSFYKSFKVTAFERDGDSYFLKGMASGSRRTTDAGKIEVKAVTLHECSVAEKDGEWKARVLLDV
ncbi:MAG: archease [Candidatus Micrarchaeia archaeon]